MKTKFMNQLRLVIAILSASIFLFAGQGLAASCTDPNLSSKEQIQCGANQASGSTGTTGPGQGVQNTIKDVINILSLVGGALAVIMLIVGGLRYVLSAGNPETTKAAKNTIIYALVGLVIIAVAQIIVQFVLNKATNP